MMEILVISMIAYCTVDMRMRRMKQMIASIQDVVVLNGIWVTGWTKDKKDSRLMK